MGYGYDKEGKTFSYKMGPAMPHAAEGAKKVPRDAVLHRPEQPALCAPVLISRATAVHRRNELGA
jgi:hypothetical protein